MEIDNHHTINLDRFTPVKPQEYDIKGKKYLIIAERYDGCGQFVYVFIERPSGTLKILYWQDSDPMIMDPHIFELYSNRIQ